MAGGALQAICEAWEAIANVDEAGLRVDLLFSRRDPAFDLTCPPPGPAPIIVRLREQTTLRVRMPSWAQPPAVTYAINGSPPASAADVIIDGYFELGELPPKSTVELWLPSRRETTRELIGGQQYEIDWHNDTVVDMRPPARFQALYGLDAD